MTGSNPIAQPSQRAAIQNEQTKRQNSKAHECARRQSLAQNSPAQHNGHRRHKKCDQHEVTRPCHGQNTVVEQIGQHRCRKCVIGDGGEGFGAQIKRQGAFKDPSQRNDESAVQVSIPAAATSGCSAVRCLRAHTPAKA